MFDEDTATAGTGESADPWTETTFAKVVPLCPVFAAPNEKPENSALEPVVVAATADVLGATAVLLGSENANGAGAVRIAGAAVDAGGLATLPNAGTGTAAAAAVLLGAPNENGAAAATDELTAATGCTAVTADDAGAAAAGPLPNLKADTAAAGLAA